jgi:hypothetical protein
MLTARAPEAVPLLLEAIATEDAPGTADDDTGPFDRMKEALDVLHDALCQGGSVVDLYRVVNESYNQREARPEATRAALVRALRVGPHREVAASLVAWTVAGAAECEDATPLARAVTDAAVELLAVPGARESALSVLASGKAEPTAARRALRAVLEDDTALPWAVAGLTRYGDDVSAETARLVASLPEARPDIAGADAQGAEPALAALRLLGPRAASALGALEALAAHMDERCLRPAALHVLAATIAAVGAADPPRAARALVPLRSCPDGLQDVTTALVSLGPAGAAPLISWFRGDDLPACDRFQVARELQLARFSLSAADEALEQRLWDTHCASQHTGAQFPPFQLQTRASNSELARDALNSCRAEAGLPPLHGGAAGTAMRSLSSVAPAAESAGAGAFGTCLREYACGPSRRSFEKTIRRCCERAFPVHPPSLCRVRGPRRSPWWRRLLPGGPFGH